ncbi:MAG: NifU family protein [Proteobacteria bacterium]|jgi:Fe-S cluster biogenesis protein NfuA|nr:NifU family protein [Pseudomonadota bacterium]
MFIQTEETPNPLSLKFITNCEITSQGYNVSYQRSGVLDDAPNFIKDIFTIEKVSSVMVNSGFVTVLVEDTQDWKLVKPEIIHILLDHGQNGGLKIGENADAKEETPKKEFKGIEKEIADLIEERVRPAVEMDGGDIEFIRFDEQEGIVYVKMKGSCSGCPSSSATLKSGIQRMLEYYVPEVVDVVPVED